MDKKNTILGMGLIMGAFALMFYQGSQHSDFEDMQTVDERGVAEAPAEAVPGTMAAPAGSIFEKVADERPLATGDDFGEESFYTLENEVIKVRFTSRGGAIKDVELKEFAETQGSEEAYTFNENASTPALALMMGSPLGGPQEYSPEFQLVSNKDGKILFSTKTPEGVEIYRGYSLAGEGSERDPYLLRHETRFVNKGSEALNLKQLYLALGALPPTRGDVTGQYLNVGYYDGDDAEFIEATKFKESKGIFGFGKHAAAEYIEEGSRPLLWASVKNQFFASIVKPDEAGVSVFAKQARVDNPDEPERVDEGVLGALELELGQIAPGEERLMALDYYIGPKEYTRLEALGGDVDLIMQFGWFGFISKLLLILMGWIHAFVPNWGLTIIGVTIIIKLILWPLTNIQVRSSKRMAKIQEPLKAIKEKYKDNPQKAQVETMKLFKENRVNPAAGCLPLLVQLPIFLGLFYMLRTSSELRFAEFLWISDLSLPDTIAAINGFDINILPLVMAVSMFFQMRMTPSPTTDGSQRMVMQMMPFIFLVFCYSFPSGLVLYWTVQNLLTIVQQMITNRMEDPMDNLPAAPAAKKAKKGAPTKKKKSRK